MRILQKYVAGESVVQISREEGRNRETVTKIVKGEEVGKLVQAMRGEFYGLAYDAIAAVRHALQQQKDGRVGYRLLMDIGVIPLPAEAQVNAMQARQPAHEELTPFERASATDDSGRIDPIHLAMVRAAEEKAAVFGLSLPTAAEVRHNRTIAAMVDEMTGGRNLHIILSNGVETNRLRTLAEDVLQGKRSMVDSEITEVRKQYQHKT
jgi:hypothetical protein